jgi:signal transduction histidine kinase
VSDNPTAVEITERYGPLVAPDTLSLLIEASARVGDFSALARRASSSRFMVEAVEAVAPAPISKLDEWVVKVTAHFLDSLARDQEHPDMLEIIAHESFLLGESPRWSIDHVSEDCRLQDGTDASIWIDGASEVRFHNELVRDYFVARHIANRDTNLLLRFEYPQRWVLMFLATVAPDLLTSLAATRSDRLRAEIEVEVEQKVQAALPLIEQFPTVGTTVDADASLVSRCDRRLFREALGCLVDNAFYAALETPSAEVAKQVILRARRSDALLTIRIDVLDTGAGVPPDDSERIFAPRVTTKKGGGGRPMGTGMGLPIARKFAGLMGGRIGMDSGGVNTCFFLEIPASPEADQ